MLKNFPNDYKLLEPKSDEFKGKVLTALEEAIEKKAYEEYAAALQEVLSTAPEFKNPAQPKN